MIAICLKIHSHTDTYVYVCPYKYICEHVAITCIFYTCIHRHNRKLDTPIYHQYLLLEGGILFFSLTLFCIFQLELLSSSTLPSLQAPGTISSSPQISFLLLTFFSSKTDANCLVCILWWYFETTILKLLIILKNKVLITWNSFKISLWCIFRIRIVQEGLWRFLSLLIFYIEYNLVWKIRSIQRFLVEMNMFSITYK